MSRDWILWKLTQLCWLLWFAIVVGLLFGLNAAGASQLVLLLVVVPAAVAGAYFTAWVQGRIGAPLGGSR